MKLEAYLKTVQSLGEIVAFDYRFNGEAADTDIEQFKIRDGCLILDELAFPLDTEGALSGDAFAFTKDGSEIEISAML